MGGVSAAVSKTAAAPIERVKLLIQNQDEMLKTGRQVQVFHGCWSPDYRQGGFQVSLQGCWCQHSPWCGRCRCLVHLRSNAGPDVRKGFQVEDDNCSIDCVGGVVEAGNGAEVI